MRSRVYYRQTANHGNFEFRCMYLLHTGSDTVYSFDFISFAFAPVPAPPSVIVPCSGTVFADEVDAGVEGFTGIDSIAVVTAVEVEDFGSNS